jgi:hypothetical protein
MFYFVGSTNLGDATIIQLQKSCLYKGKTVLPKVRFTYTLSFSVCYSKILTDFLLKSFIISLLFLRPYLKSVALMVLYWFIRLTKACTDNLRKALIRIASPISS